MNKSILTKRIFGQRIGGSMGFTPELDREAKIAIESLKRHLAWNQRKQGKKRRNKRRKG